MEHQRNISLDHELHTKYHRKYYTLDILYIFSHYPRSVQFCTFKFLTSAYKSAAWTLHIHEHNILGADTELYWTMIFREQGRPFRISFSTTRSRGCYGARFEEGTPVGASQSRISPSIKRAICSHAHLARVREKEPRRTGATRKSYVH